MSGSLRLDQGLHVPAAISTNARLLKNPLRAIRTFAFLAGLAGKAGAVAGTVFHVVGIGLLANGAGFHERPWSLGALGILTDVSP